MIRVPEVTPTGLTFEQMGAPTTSRNRSSQNWLPSISGSSNRLAYAREDNDLVLRHISSPHYENRLVVTLSRLDSDWLLIKPITIYVTFDEDGDYLISDEIFWKHGIGSTYTEAYSMYIESLTFYYETVEESAENGNEASQKLLNFMQTYMQKTNE